MLAMATPQQVQQKPSVNPHGMIPLDTDARENIISNTGHSPIEDVSASASQDDTQRPSNSLSFQQNFEDCEGDRHFPTDRTEGANVTKNAFNATETVSVPNICSIGPDRCGIVQFSAPSGEDFSQIVLWCVGARGMSWTRNSGL